MSRVERLPWPNPFFEQSVQNIVLRFNREVMKASAGQVAITSACRTCNS